MNRMSVEGGGAGSVAPGHGPTDHALRWRGWVMNPQVRALVETKGNGPVLYQGKNAGGARKLCHVLKLERLGHAPRFPTSPSAARSVL